MTDPPHPNRPRAFVIRVHRDRHGLRGQVVAVESGASRLFDDLGDALAFIKAQVDAEAGPAAPEEKDRDR